VTINFHALLYQHIVYLDIYPFVQKDEMNARQDPQTSHDIVFPVPIVFIYNHPITSFDAKHA